MEQEVNRHCFRLQRYPQPKDVLEAALAKIQPDGSVLVYDKKYDERYRFNPNRPVDLTELPTEAYQHRQLKVAQAIEAGCSNIALARRPQEADYFLAVLANYLTAFRHDPAFLERATSMVTVDERGFLYPPRLPLVPPTE